MLFLNRDSTVIVIIIILWLTLILLCYMHISCLNTIVTAMSDIKCRYCFLTTYNFWKSLFVFGCFHCFQRCLEVNNLVGTPFHHRNSLLPEFTCGSSKTASWGWQSRCHNNRRKERHLNQPYSWELNKNCIYLLFDLQLHITDTSLYCFLVGQCQPFWTAHYLFLEDFY
jgi:hypothetical protein